MLLPLYIETPKMYSGPSKLCRPISLTCLAWLYVLPGIWRDFFFLDSAYMLPVIGSCECVQEMVITSPFLCPMWPLWFLVLCVTSRTLTLCVLHLYSSFRIPQGNDLYYYACRLCPLCLRQDVNWMYTICYLCVPLSAHVGNRVHTTVCSHITDISIWTVWQPLINSAESL